MDEWKKRGNLYSLDEEEPIAVADLGGIYCVYNGNQRVLFTCLMVSIQLKQLGLLQQNFIGIF